MLSDLLVDLVFAAGTGLVVYGVWLVYRPAGLIVAGAALVCCAGLYARRG